MFVQSFTFVLFSFLCFPISQGRIHPRAEIKLSCPEARGAASCDWRCYDKCVAPYGPYLNVRQMTSCLDEINADCRIPGVALVNLRPNWYCSSPGMMPDSHQGEVAVGQRAFSSYVFEIPRFEASNVKVNRAHTEDISVDVAATFDSDLCRSVAAYVVAGNQGRPQMEGDSFPNLPNVQKCARDSQVLQNTLAASAGFGFHLLNLNFTRWAQDYETASQRLIGESPLVIDLATTHACWAPATNISIYHATGFTAASHINGVTSTIRNPALLFPLLLLMSVLTFSRS